MAALSALAHYNMSDGDSEDDNEEKQGKNEETVLDVKDNEKEDESVKDDEDLDDIKEPSDVSEMEEVDEEMIVTDEETVKEIVVPQKSAKLKFKRYSCDSATALAAKLQGMTDDEIRLPPEPEGRCSNQLQEKIKRLYEKKIKEGENLNQVIQERKDFRNPSIYEKLILFLNIQERGTNFPKSEFDPSAWRKVPDYEDLARAQREDVAKKEREKKTKVEFVTGTVKKPSSGSIGGDAVKKSKWDKPLDENKGQQTITATKVPLGTLPTSKTTIISSVSSKHKSKS